MDLCCSASASIVFPMNLRRSAPASNKPHPAEKYSGLASNLAHLDRICQLAAAVCELSCTYLYICVHPHCCHLGVAAQTDANLSAHLHRLPTPPPYLRRMRLLHGRGAGIRWVIRLLPGRMRRSCKSPHARIPVLGTSGAHWPARWPRF